MLFVPLQNLYKKSVWPQNLPLFLLFGFFFNLCKIHAKKSAWSLNLSLLFVLFFLWVKQEDLGLLQAMLRTPWDACWRLNLPHVKHTLSALSSVWSLTSFWGFISNFTSGTSYICILMVTFQFTYSCIYLHLRNGVIDKQKLLCG